MKKVIGLFLILFSVNSFANWTFVSSTADNTLSVYVDFSTKKKVGGYIRVWSLVDTSRTFKKVHSYKVLEEFDCSLDRTRLIQMSAYSGRMGVGDVINTTKGDNSWDYIRPKTVEEDVFKRICS